MKQAERYCREALSQYGIAFDAAMFRSYYQKHNIPYGNKMSVGMDAAFYIMKSTTSINLFNQSL
jgi:hypothetical protein